MKIKVSALALLIAISLPANAQTKKRRISAKAKPVVTVQKESEKFEEMLDNTQRLFVIDSTVVGKPDAATAIPLAKDMGEVILYNKVFSDKSLPGTYLYMNGFGNKCFYAESDTLGNSRLYCREKLNGKWEKPRQIKGLADDLKYINYPFMKSDGETFYFSAISEEGLGGYDIYVARYDSEDDTFLQAENLGLPYNSYDDDYMYEEDDINGFVWFSSTRNQPEGKACVYTIKSAEKRTNYDADDYDEKELKALAKLSRIRDTWTTPEQRDAAMNKLRSIKAVAHATGSKGNLSFVVDDELTYNDAESFSSAESRQLYKSLLALEQKKDDLYATLDSKRMELRTRDKQGKSALRAEIAKYEADYDRLLDELKNTANKLRAAEQKKKH